MDDQSALPHVEISDDLATAISAHPLFEGVPDADVNQAELALALNVTANTVGKWVAQSVLAEAWTETSGIPVVEQGGLGRAYVIRLSHAWAWRQHSERQREQKSAASRRAIEMLQAKMLGLDVDQPDAVIDPVMRRKMAEADIQWQRASQLRRKLVELDEMTVLMEDVCRIIRNGIEGMPDRLERELGLKPEQVDLVERLGDDILAEMVDRIEEAHLEEQDIVDVEPQAQLTI